MLSDWYNITSDGYTALYFWEDTNRNQRVDCRDSFTLLADEYDNRYKHIVLNNCPKLG